MSEDKDEIISCLESISGKEMTLDNFFLFMKEILPNGYSREFTSNEEREDFDRLISGMN